MAQDSNPSFFFVATLMNFVLATGIFTLPFSLFESGVILGSLVLILTCMLSIVACTFIIETLAMQNAFLKNEQLVLSSASIIRRETITQNDYAFSKSKVFNQEETKEEIHLIETNNLKVENIPLGVEEDDNFFIFKRIEISKMANKVFTKPVYYFVVISMLCYLYIGLTSNAMIAGRSILSITSKVIGQDLDHSYYYVIVVGFFLCVVSLALYNINHLKKFSMFVMVCRFVMIILILGSCIYSISVNGMAEFSKVPKFDITNITVIIGNSLFLFMSHHSMPGMVENFKPQKNLIKLIVTAYAFSLVLMLSYGYVTILAFGGLLDPADCDNKHFPCAIQSNFNLNFISFSPIGYIINYYPLLNIITSSLLAITLKNNILHILGNCSPKLANSFNFSEKSGFMSIVYGFIFNVCLVSPSIFASMTLGDVQQLMKYFSSVFGFIIMIIIPTLLIYSTRKKLLKFNLSSGNLNRSFLNKTWHLYALATLGVAIFSMIIYGFVNTNNKTCVAQK